MSVDRDWSTAARGWGWVVGIAVAAGNLLYLVEARGMLGPLPTYQPTSAGQLQDEAAYWVAFFAYRNATLWDYYLRDGLFFLGYLGFIPLVLAANAVTGGGRALVQVAGGFVLVGALLGALNAVSFYVDIAYWRNTGWEQVPAPIMDAVGRGTELIADLGAWLGAFAGAAFAIGLAYLGRACQREAALPGGLAPVAYLAAAASGLSFGLVVLSIPGMDAVRDLLGLVAGVLLTPILAIGLGRHLGRPQPAIAGAEAA